MSDLPPDLPRLRTLRTWHAMWVARIDEAITEAERRDAEEQHRRERAARPRPEWIVEREHSGPPTIHTGDCGIKLKGLRVAGCTQEEARRALADGANDCPLCRPDNALGLIL